MIRLVTVCLVSAAIRSVVAGSYQTGPSGGESSPLYNVLASSLLSKYHPQNTSADVHASPPGLTCTCGFCNQRTPFNPGPPQDPLQGSPILSGVVLFPASELQQALRAPVPLYGPSPHPPPRPQPETQPSYIMTIPKRYPPQPPPANIVKENPYPPPQQNPVYSIPPPPPKSSPPRAYYYTPKPPLVASCPATVYFPASPSLSFNQPTIYPPPPGPPSKVVPPINSYPPGPNLSPKPHPNHQIPSSPPLDPQAPPVGSNEPLVTYTLRTSDSADILPGTSLEAENKDCSVPIPPVLV